MSTTTTQSVAIQTGRVTTEGDDLFYEVRGAGEPLLLIPPAGGDGWQYSYIADILADEFKVITYDRRANGRSTMNSPQNFEISQQSRDAVAVIKAVGETSAHVFGNSSGAVIALDMAKTQPQAVRILIAHEPPVPRVHPDAEKWQRFFARVYLSAFRFGPSLAALQFMTGVGLPMRPLISATKPVNLHRSQSAETYLSDKTVTEVLTKWELLPITNYLPDVAQIRQNGVKMCMAAGQWSLDHKKWYAETAQIVAKQLGCAFMAFPGHHGSFMDQPQAFADVLRRTLHQVQATAR